MKMKSPTDRFGVSSLHLLCAVLLMFGGMLAHGQGKRGPAPSNPATNPSFPQVPAPSALSLTQSKAVDGNPVSPKQEDSCFLPPLTGVQMATVEVADLQVPPKAQKEYEDGCAALRNRKM